MKLPNTVKPAYKAPVQENVPIGINVKTQAKSLVAVRFSPAIRLRAVMRLQAVPSKITSGDYSFPKYFEH